MVTFYYQAYVYNPETKKDKRVFHALGTKSISEAELKQKELDDHYKRDNNQNINSSKKILISNQKEFYSQP